MPERKPKEMSDPGNWRQDEAEAMGNPWHEALEDTARLLGLCTELVRWEGTADGDPLAAHHRGTLAQYLNDLRSVAAGRQDRIDGVLLAVLALGPRGALPGAGDLGPLLEAASETDADPVDLAIAWGCGWRRPVVADHEWHGRWVAALLALSSLVSGSINRTVRWLEDHVAGVRMALRWQDDQEREERFGSHAQRLAMELSLGACRCGHGGRGARPGHGCGRPDHELASWRPESCSLPAHVATAVRGSPGLPVRGGAFAVSMLADLLREDHLVRVDVAEFHVCHVCNAELLRLARQRGRVDLGSVVRGLHEFNRCPDCGTQTRPGRTYQVARKNWFVVPAEWGGQHEPAQRHRCAHCGHLFAGGHDGCPLCSQVVPSGHRLTSVWVRKVGLGVRRSSARSEAQGS
jgi:hypothetical protein